MRRRVFVAYAVAALCSSSTAFAGPPYVTDDPEPVEYRHWELYLASLVQHDAGGWTGTSPHVEVNYGAIPNVQLHLITPLAFAAPAAGQLRVGPGDTELGIKWRFVHETQTVPQIGIFPFLEVPTGSAHRALGNGAVQVFLPLWLQKSVGRWTTYCGGGAWLNAAPPPALGRGGTWGGRSSGDSSSRSRSGRRFSTRRPRRRTPTRKRASTSVS